ncbi:hypothetical protein NT07LI_1081, partial [Listeria innocua FSL S4-378]
WVKSTSLSKLLVTALPSLVLAEISFRNCWAVLVVSFV